jgi:hypothetical protein
LPTQSAKNWIDMRTVDGVAYCTYQEAAWAMGLFTNHDEGIMAFKELLDSGA